MSKTVVLPVQAGLPVDERQIGDTYTSLDGHLRVIQRFRPDGRPDYFNAPCSLICLPCLAAKRTYGHLL